MNYYLSATCFALIALMASCDQEPEDPLDRFIYQFEEKTDVLFEHMANADEVMDGEAAFAAGGGMASTDIAYYRYKHIGPAAVDVFEHFTNPEMVFYLHVTSAKTLDPEWIAELKEAYAQANDKLTQHIEQFREELPRHPMTPPQSSDLGRSYSSVFRPGGVYGANPMAKVGFYEYDDEDVLWFHVKGGKIQLDKLLSLDLDDWLNSMRQLTVEQ